MSLFTWNSEFEVGIGVIDEQHQKLVQLINGLHNHMVQGDANEIMSKVLDRVVEYTSFHFATEERLMKQYDYPETRMHLKQHSDLVETAVGLQQKLQSGHARITMETMRFLKDWLQHHILGTDKLLAAHLKSLGVE